MGFREFLKSQIGEVAEEFGKSVSGSFWGKTKKLRYFRLFCIFSYSLSVIMILDIWLNGLISVFFYSYWLWLMILIVFLVWVSSMIMYSLTSPNLQMNNQFEIQNEEKNSKIVSQQFRIIGKKLLVIAVFALISFTAVILMIEALMFRAPNSMITKFFTSFEAISLINNIGVFGKLLLTFVFLSIIIILFLVSYRKELRYRRTFADKTKDKSNLKQKAKFVMTHHFGTLMEVFCLVPTFVSKTIAGQSHELGCVLGVVPFEILRRGRNNMLLHRFARVDNPDFIKYVLKKPTIQFYVDLRSSTIFMNFGDYTLIGNPVNSKKIQEFEKMLSKHVISRTKWFEGE